LKLGINFKSDDNLKLIKKSLDKIFAQSNMAKWMQETADDIKKRTKLGYGVEKDMASREKFDNLSDHYVKFRKENPYNELDGSTSPGKSNLTYSGQMLNALRGASKSAYQGDIYLDNKRRRLEGDSKSFTNNELAVWNAEKGRNFLAISDLEYKRLVQKIEKELTKEIRQAFKSK